MFDLLSQLGLAGQYQGHCHCPCCMDRMREQIARQAQSLSDFIDSRPKITKKKEMTTREFVSLMSSSDKSRIVDQIKRNRR